MDGKHAGERGPAPIVLVGRGIAVVDDHQLGDRPNNDERRANHVGDDDERGLHERDATRLGLGAVGGTKRSASSLTGRVIGRPLPALRGCWSRDDECVQSRLDRSDGGADVTAAQAARPVQTGAVLAQGRERGDGTGDGVAHRCDLAAAPPIVSPHRHRNRRPVLMPSPCTRPCRVRAPIWATAVACSARRRPLRQRPQLACPELRHLLVHLDVARPHSPRDLRPRGVSLFDRGSHSRVLTGVFEDDENVLGAVSRPRRHDAAIVNAQRLRRECDRRSVGRGRSTRSRARVLRARVLDVLRRKAIKIEAGLVG